MNGAVDGAAGSGGAAGRLRAALVDYLTLRRALGFALRRDEKLLIQFLTYLEDHGKDTVTVADALAWASLPVGASPAWLGFRMGVVRGFAGYLHALDPNVVVPPRGLLPGTSASGALPLLRRRHRRADGPDPAAADPVAGSHDRDPDRVAVGDRDAHR
jgi:hypothetical protein